jgi:hypothetical protein
MPDWVVCDTIANGSRHAVAGRGTRGAALLRFEKIFPGGGLQGATVRVLGEVTPGCCTALKLLSPAAVRGKIWKIRDF